MSNNNKNRNIATKLLPAVSSVQATDMFRVNPNGADNDQVVTALQIATYLATVIPSGGIPTTGTPYKLLQYDVNGDIQETEIILDNTGIVTYDIFNRLMKDQADVKLFDGQSRMLSDNFGGDAMSWTDGVSIINFKRAILQATLTAGGTTGAQTINKIAGSVNFAAAATTLVVTNNLVETTSIVLVQVHGADVTAISARVTTATGSFTITLNSAATAETKVSFVVFGTV